VVGLALSFVTKLQPFVVSGGEYQPPDIRNITGTSVVRILQVRRLIDVEAELSRP